MAVVYSGVIGGGAAGWFGWVPAVREGLVGACGLGGCCAVKSEDADMFREYEDMYLTE